MGDDAESKPLFEAWEKVFNAIGENTRQFNPMSLQDNSVITETQQSWWNSIFAVLGGNAIPPTAAFTTNGSLNEEWQDFLLSQMLAPAVLIIIGVIVCIATFSRLCCSSAFKVEGTQRHARPLVCFALWFFIFFFCAGFCVLRGNYAIKVIHNEFDALVQDLDVVHMQAIQLHPAWHNAAIWMGGWTESCIGWSLVKDNKKIIAFTKKTGDLFTNVGQKLYQLDTLSDSVAKITSKIGFGLDAMTDNKALKWTISLIIFLPSLLVIKLVCTLLLAVWFDGMSSRVTMWTNYILMRGRWSLVPVTIGILLMTIVSAVCLLVGIVFGTFCQNPEHNAIRLVSSMEQQGLLPGGGMNVTSLVSFFLIGEPDTNKLVELTKTVENDIFPLERWFWILLPALDLLGLVCNRVGNAALGPLFEKTIPALKQMLPIVQRDNIYKHYDIIVNQGICGELVECIGWYMWCQLGAGLILLPIIARMAHRALKEIEANEECKAKDSKSKEEAARLLSQEEEAERSRKSRSRDIFSCCSRSRQVRPDGLE